MRTSILIAVFFLLLSNSGFTQKKEKNKKIKKAVKNTIVEAVSSETGDDLAGELAGSTVMTIFNFVEDRIERKRARNAIEDANNQLVHFVLTEHKKDINRLKITPDSKYLVSTDENKRLIITDLERKEVIHEIKLSKEAIDIKFHPDRPIMALAMSGKLELWDLQEFTKIKELKLKGSDSYLAPSSSLIYFHPTEPSQLIQFDPFDRFFCYDFITEEMIYKSKIDIPAVFSRPGGFVKSWFPTKDGKNIIVQTRRRTYLWNPYNEKEIIVYQNNEGSEDFIGIPYTIVDVNQLFTSSDDELIIYDSNSGRRLSSAPLKIATTKGQAFEDKLLLSPDKKFFLIAGRDILNNQEIVSLDVYKMDDMSKMISFPSDLQDRKEYFHYDWSSNGKFIVKYCGSCKDDEVIIYNVEQE